TRSSSLCSFSAWSAPCISRSAGHCRLPAPAWSGGWPRRLAKSRNSGEEFFRERNVMSKSNGINFGIDRRRTLMLRAAAISAPSLLGTAAHAITPAEIKSKGKLVIGIQGDNPPWGFVDTSGKQDGFDADIGRLFAKDLGVEAEFMPLAVANRIPALTAGRVDI